MTDLGALRELVLLLGASVTVIGVCHQFKVPPVVGLLFTGVLVGPSGLGWVHHSARIEFLAELGVVLLLFGVGLELSLERLRSLGRLLSIGGPLQVLLTWAVVAGLALVFGEAPRQALFYGLLVALSSTAIVFKRMAERGELDTPQGRAATGILIFQDLLIVPLLLLVPLLAGTEVVATPAMLVRIAIGIAVVAATAAAGRYLVPRLLTLLAETRIRELLLLGSLFVCLGASLLAHALGFSLALGALLAGVLISGSDVEHQVLAETGPLRDIFNSLFFVSVGMLFSLRLAWEHLGTVLGVALGVMILKAAIVWVVVGILGYPMRTRIATALALSQIGELSFVLAASGHRLGLVSGDVYGLVVAITVVTMMLTPTAIALGARLQRLGLSQEESPHEEAGLAGHVVIAGFGLNGRHLARVLRSAGIPYRVIDLSARRVRSARKSGEPIILGDVTRPEILRHARLAHARLAVFAISDEMALEGALRLAKSLAPNTFLVARVRSFERIPRLKAAGADTIIAEEFESSVEIVMSVLRRLHVPGNVIRAEARILRAEGYEMLRNSSNRGLSDMVVQALAAGTTDSFLLAEHHAAVGKTLSQIGLRHRSGASVIALLRVDRSLSNPPPELILRAGDVLVLFGSHEEVEAAFRLLEDTEMAAAAVTPMGGAD